MKKFLWSLSIVSILGLASCGGGSSDEAKALLQKILNLVGIPQSIVVNICQDENRDGICGVTELQAEVSINKGDTVATIWNKITNTAEGRYLLETYDATLPLLLELQNTGSEHYTDKFTIPFNGLAPTEDEKDLSILQAMVDAGYLTANDISAVKEMDNREEFYEVLLKDFEINLNTLKEKELSSPRAVLANLGEMAEELKEAGIDGELPRKIDACEDDDNCIEEAMENTIIDEAEAEGIQDNETKELKRLLVGKTLYLSEPLGEKDYFNKLEFNSEGTLVTDTYLLEENSQRTYPINLEINRFTSLDTENYNIFLKVNRDYILFDAYQSAGTADGQSRLYFDKDKAEAYYSESVDSNAIATTEPASVEIEDRLKPLIAGKTYYITACDTENPHVEKLDFATNNKLTISWEEDGETKNRLFDYTTDYSTLTLFYEGNSTVVTSFSNVQEEQEKLIFEEGVFFQNQSDADNNLNELGCLGYYIDKTQRKIWEFEHAGFEMTYDESAPTIGGTVITSPYTTSGSNSNEIDAVKYCEGLKIGDYDDWDVPSLDDLQNINKDIFQDNELFWSSTKVDENKIYTINITNGIEEKSAKSEKHLIRCVRDGI
ncbi:DUF1566 domain-containing protein [Sulfurovum sp. bin170]|uniref:DUF1566 domain-containing protein n=1 Tax=Sulfurovum sp. bin170 TaxID=2695268 RepID=UPI0013E05B74|nr:DUF1566 domain-containing protein [Sulfurovum sp. bin170]NEW61511.1 DUF1566 domain-containing protein [Sulfurovum sp. bin170]